jgi:hypothetical protein
VSPDRPDAPCPPYNAKPLRARSSVGARSPHTRGAAERHTGRVAQWESVRFTRGRSLVRNQPRPFGISPSPSAVCRRDERLELVPCGGLTGDSDIPRLSPCMELGSPVGGAAACAVRRKEQRAGRCRRRRWRLGSAAAAPPSDAAASFSFQRRCPAGRRLLVVALAAYFVLRATLGGGRLTLGSRQSPFANDLCGRSMVSHSLPPGLDVMVTIRPTA